MAHAPSPDTVQKLLKAIYPDSRFKAISPVAGKFSNYTHIVEVTGSDRKSLKIVIKRYAVFGNYDRGEKAHREYMALKFAFENNIPVPEPLLLDENGMLLGSPGIVTVCVEGDHDINPVNPESWARALAATLAKIHSLPCEIPDKIFILDANKEASWFLRDKKPPEFMKSYPRGLEVWRAAHDLYPGLQKAMPRVVHIDYWPGNVLWRNGRIVAVLDWEEAAYGDPVIDLAYARMEMHIMGLPEAADIFLREYEAITEQEAKNLLFWELAAAARPMFSPGTWDITDSPRRDRFDNFIKRVLTVSANR